MGRIVKIALLVLAAGILAAAGILLYYYAHPEAVAKIVEKSISRLAGVSIERLSYSLNPLHVRMEGISITPAEGSSGFSLKIPQLTADLELEGRFGSKTLVLKTIRVNGFSLEYDEAAFESYGRPSDPDSMFKAALKHLAAFFLFRDVRLREVQLEDGNAVAELSDLSVAAGGITAGRNADRQIEFKADAGILLRSENASLRIPNLHLLTADTVSLSEMKIGARVSAAGASFQSAELSIADIGLILEGTLDIEKRRLLAPYFSFRIADAVDIEGSLNAGGGRQKEFAVTVDRARIVPGQLMAMAPERIAKRLDPLQFLGESSAGGVLEASTDGNRWEYAYDFAFRLMNNPISYVSGKHRFGGEVEGTLTARGDSAGAEITAELNSESAFYTDSERSVKLSDVRVSVAGRDPEYRIESLSARILQVSGIPIEEKIPLEDFRVQVQKGVLNVESRTLRLPRVEMESAWLPKVAAGIEADANAFRIRIDKGSGLIASAKKLNLISTGWQLSGSDFFSIELILTGMNTLSIDSRLRFENFAFQDPEALWVGEGIDFELLYDGRLELEDFSMAGSASLQAAAGELLYDLFYFDLAKHPFSALYEGRFDPAGKQLSFARLELGLEKALLLNVSGRLDLDSPTRGQLSIQAPAVPIDTFFRLFVVEPFQRERPYLSGMEIGGRLAADLEATGEEGGWSVKGHIRWAEGLLAVKEKGIRADGIQIDYPVWYRSDPGAESSQPIPGRVSVDALKIEPVVDQPFRFEMAAEKNRMSVPALPKIDLPWGSISTGPIGVVDLYSEKRTIRTALSVSPLDLTPLLSEIWPKQRKAVLRGRLDPVVIRGDRVETQGELLLEAFEGSVVLSEVGADRLATDSPAVSLNAQIQDIRLGPLTEETNFGKIEGVLAGYIRNLQIAYGQPQRFDLLLETVKRRGVPQRISIKAVENIARIGGGQSPFMGLAGAFTALFESLNYEKIGIRATLENDLFRLNGTIEEDGKEYFIKGGLIAGVNIINQNPDNRIRFRDMVKRIQRVTSDAATPRIE